MKANRFIQTFDLMGRISAAITWASIVLAYLLILLLAGCAPNYVKIIKLDVSGQWIPFSTAVTGGCIAEVKGNPKNVVLTYADDQCVANFTGDKR